MKSWLLGGLIGIGLYILNGIFLVAICSSASATSWCGLLGIVTELGFLAIPMIIGNLIVVFLIGALIGAIVGWIIRKMKSV